MIQTIRSAATELARLQRARGADGALAMVTACYERQLARARSFDPPLQACVAQDIVLAKVSASVYGRVSPTVRLQTGSPDPQRVLDDMSKRVVGVFARLGIAEADGRRFNRLVNENGLDAFLKEYARK